jgi:hypothetical protein
MDIESNTNSSSISTSTMSSKSVSSSATAVNGAMSETPESVLDTLGSHISTIIRQKMDSKSQSIRKDVYHKSAKGKGKVSLGKYSLNTFHYDPYGTSASYVPACKCTSTNGLAHIEDQMNKCNDHKRMYMNDNLNNANMNMNSDNHTHLNANVNSNEDEHVFDTDRSHSHLKRTSSPVLSHEHNYDESDHDDDDDGDNNDDDVDIDNIFNHHYNIVGGNSINQNKNFDGALSKSSHFSSIHNHVKNKGEKDKEKDRKRDALVHRGVRRQNRPFHHHHRSGVNFDMDATSVALTSAPAEFNANGTNREADGKANSFDHFDTTEKMNMNINLNKMLNRTATLSSQSRVPALPSSTATASSSSFSSTSSTAFNSTLRSNPSMADIMRYMDEKHKVVSMNAASSADASRKHIHSPSLTSTSHAKTRIGTQPVTANTKSKTDASSATKEANDSEKILRHMLQLSPRLESGFNTNSSLHKQMHEVYIISDSSAHPISASSSSLSSLLTSSSSPTSSLTASASTSTLLNGNGLNSKSDADGSRQASGFDSNNRYRHGHGFGHGNDRFSSLSVGSSHGIQQNKPKIVDITAVSQHSGDSVSAKTRSEIVAGNIAGISSPDNHDDIVAGIGLNHQHFPPKYQSALDLCQPTFSLSELGAQLTKHWGNKFQKKTASTGKSNCNKLGYLEDETNASSASTSSSSKSSIRTNVGYHGNEKLNAVEHIRSRNGVIGGRGVAVGGDQTYQIIRKNMHVSDTGIEYFELSV